MQVQVNVRKKDTLTFPQFLLGTTEQELQIFR